jgi:hypothetical protein
MKIVDEKMNQTVCFSDLAPGTVFFFPSEKWYGMCLHNGAYRDNAVDLQTGELVSLLEWDQVVPLADAYLVV